MLLDPDETTGVTVDAWGFEPVPPAVREAAKPARDERPEIIVSTEELEVNTKAIAALATDRSVYQRGTALVRVVCAKDSPHPTDSVCDPAAPTIGMLPRSILQERLATVARWYVPKNKDGELVKEPVHPPPWSVDAVRDRGEWPGIQRLEGIVEHPILRPDGSIFDEPGYDERTGLLFLDNGIVFPRVARSPSWEDARNALALIADIAHDFPFVSEKHKSAWLAAVLTPIARHAFRGPSPLFLFDAPKMGTGKSLAMDVAIRIATGRAAPLEAYTTDDNEMKKTLISWSVSGRPIVSFDNVEGRFGGASLCLAITGTVVSGRVLGLSQHWTGPLRPTWYATGNNVDPTPDMVRRICHVRLVAKVEDPSSRGGFKHRLPEDIAALRGALVAAALTVLRAYIMHDKPKQEIKPWGSFEGWSDLVRSAIVWAGREDMDTRSELRSVADSRADVERAMVIGWRELVAHCGEPVTAKRAIEVACTDDRDSEGRIIGDGPLPDLRASIEAVSMERGKVSAGRLGYVLRKLREQVFEVDGRMVMLDAAGKDRAGVQRWTVVAADPSRSTSRSAPPGPLGMAQGMPGDPQHDPQQTFINEFADVDGDAGHAGDTSNPTRVGAQAHARVPTRARVLAGASPACPASPADDDEGPVDLLDLEIARLRHRWADGIGPRPRWPVEAKARWEALYRERRAAGETEEDAGRGAVDAVDAELRAASKGAA